MLFGRGDILTIYLSNKNSTLAGHDDASYFPPCCQYLQLTAITHCPGSKCNNLQCTTGCLWFFQVWLYLMRIIFRILVFHNVFLSRVFLYLGTCLCNVQTSSALGVSVIVFTWCCSTSHTVSLTWINWLIDWTYLRLNVCITMIRIIAISSSSKKLITTIAVIAPATNIPSVSLHVCRIK